MNPENTPTQPAPAFWLALENVPGGHALPTIWKRHLGPEFDSFASLFLKSRPDDPASAVPCPFDCSCFHRVVPQENGTLHGICQCSPQRCETYTVVPEEIIPLELDWPKITQLLSRAFACHSKTLKFGLHNTVQIGAWSADAVPVVLTLSSSRPEFLNTIAVLVARLGQPFILLAPTNRHLGAAAKELLANTGALFFSLSDTLCLQSSSPAAPKSDEGGSSGLQLASLTPPAKLLAELAPLRADPSDEELARRTFTLLQEADQETRRQPPSLYTIFQLYCVKEMTIPQISRKCRCSVGTVANRLKLLRDKTGVSHERLRRMSVHFVKFDDDFRQAERNYRRPRRLRD